MDFLVVAIVIVLFALGVFVVIEGFVGGHVRLLGRRTRTAIPELGSTRRGPHRPNVESPAFGARRRSQIAVGFVLMLLALVITIVAV